MGYSEKTETKTYNGHNIATVLHDAGSKNIVVFCHGYRSSTIGPNRFFVRAARKLAKSGISSLRFDQFGSGNSEGDFLDSSFNDWVKTAKSIAIDYLEQGYNVALFGQSMGGSTVLVVGSELPNLTAIVAWVPDANIERFTPPESGVIEEAGQIVRAQFWQEAHDAGVAEKFQVIKAPTYIVQCTADEYVDKQNRDALSNGAKAHQKVEIFEGYGHSSWSYEQSEEIINKSVNFLTSLF